MAVPDAILLLAVGRAHARIHVEHDAAGRPSAVHKVDPLAGQVGRAERFSGATVRQRERCGRCELRQLFQSRTKGARTECAHGPPAVSRACLCLLASPRLSEKIPAAVDRSAQKTGCLLARHRDDAIEHEDLH